MAVREMHLAQILQDLDRCPHGKHRGEVCAGYHPSTPHVGCKSGRSEGNPHIPNPGNVLGYDAFGHEYIVPINDHTFREPESYRLQPGWFD